jgi:anaerobic ribonucleoside-triphosphate reductase activating protein
MQIKLAGIIKESVVDGPGVRMVIFAQGCDHCCEGCQNPDSHDPRGGYWQDVDELFSEFAAVKHLAGITISGGEPFLQAAACASLAEKVKAFGKSVLLYSGYTFEELMVMAGSSLDFRRLLMASDILVDGPFILAQKNLDLAFRGSENQRIIDVLAALAAGEAVLDASGRWE